MVAAGVLSLVGACLVLDRFLLAHPHIQQPGIRTGTWRRTRDLPRTPEGQPVQKATIRTARKYFGPTPSAQELEKCRATGLCDAFYDYLKPESKGQVDAAVAELDQVLDQIGDACDEAIEVAKQAIRGTPDEFVHSAHRPQEENQKLMRAFLAQAMPAGDVCVSDSWGGAMRNYRIRQAAHPQVYELRRQDADLNQIRQQRLHEEIADLFTRHGCEVLDRGEMERAWAETLAQARRR